MNASPPGPIFIVGAARSGTELVRGMLNRHLEIHLATETHYFDDLRPRLGSRAVSGLEGKERTLAIDYFRGLRHRAYGLSGDPELSDWSAELLDDAARSLGSGGDALFAAYCQLSAAEAGKVIWGEKTPRHVFRVEEMLEAFPTARIIVVLRDVRGVVASYRDWRNRWFDTESLLPEMKRAVIAEEARAAASYSLTLIALLWCSAVRTAARWYKRYGSDRVIFLRFEDVLLNPEDGARLLASQVGVPFDRAMLDAAIVNSSYVGSHTKLGFDAAVADRWRDNLSHAERRHIDLIAGCTLSNLGYERDNLGISVRHSGWELVTFGVAVLRALIFNRARIANPLRYLQIRMAGLIS